MKFTLFLPMYNVAARVTAVLEAIPPGSLDSLVEVLLIDNGSSDGTVEVVEDCLRRRRDPRFRLFRNEENYYLGGSTVLAIRMAIANGSDFLLCLHSDGQADPREIPNFISRARPGLDFIFGSRLGKGAGTAEYSLLRLWGNRFFAWLQRRISRQPINDIGAFVAFNLRTLEKMPYWRIPHDMAYQPLLVLYACTLREIRFEEFPIRWGRVEGSNVNAFSYGLVHLWRLVAMGFGYFPLRDKAPGDFRTEEVKWH